MQLPERLCARSSFCFSRQQPPTLGGSRAMSSASMKSTCIDTFFNRMLLFPPPQQSRPVHPLGDGYIRSLENLRWKSCVCKDVHYCSSIALQTLQVSSVSDDCDELSNTSPPGDLCENCKKTQPFNKY
ncbi:hypothetical protein E5288_WYG012211 [Bos mutus]|uniref:Uncharacterized protein n=1 Tax=Bos mutus TaxID=72004 RepID=A0A6B0RNL0_9CETA|nr:hypothetical protein [Bos mutus]